VNDGTCTPLGFGYTCTCPPHYSGVRCEIGPVCNVTKAIQCLAIIKTASEMNVESGDFTQTCKNTTILLECLTETLVSCPNVNGTIFDLVKRVLEVSVQRCQRNETQPTCELTAAKSCVSILVGGIFFPPAVGYPSRGVCGYLAGYHECVRNMSVTCGDRTELSIELVHKSW